VVARPKLLLADEPTGNLDAEMSEEIMKLLLQFNASGVSVLFATHDRELLNRFRFPQIVLADGQLKHLGPARVSSAALNTAGDEVSV